MYILHSVMNLKMIKIYILLISLFVTGCSHTSNHSGSDMKGNGNLVTEMRDLPEFIEIEMYIAYDKITVNAGARQSFKIIGDENIVPLVQTQVINGVLQISSDSSFNTKAESEIIIEMESIASFTFDGVGESVINNLNEDNFICTLNGVGSCTLFGKGNKLEISVNGVGSVDAQNLIAENVIASLNGVGSAKVYAVRSLDASANGIGGLTYYGNPKELNLNNSGLGGISKGD